MHDLRSEAHGQTINTEKEQKRRKKNEQLKCSEIAVRALRCGAFWNWKRIKMHTCQPIIYHTECIYANEMCVRVHTAHTCTLLSPIIPFNVNRKIENMLRESWMTLHVLVLRYSILSHIWIPFLVLQIPENYVSWDFLNYIKFRTMSANLKA